MSVYYIDVLSGDDKNDGLSIETAKENYNNLNIMPGDKVLFRRGTEIRGSIESPSGTADARIYYGAYGSGPDPVFYGSINRSESYLWKESGIKNVWELAIPLKSEPCNVIFDFGRECGVLSWDKRGLDKNGKWFSDEIGNHKCEGADFFLYCEKNPGEYYKDIEIALYGKRTLLTAKNYVTFEGLSLFGSGVHGFGATNVKGIEIKDCRFDFIGGCVWSKERKIRFGNGVEFWDGAKDCKVTDCSFCDIYDSCVTTQGTDKMAPPENISFTGNTFMRFGMAAYEIRDRIGKNVLFEFNVCEDAGGGFSIQDETPPRNSEIYPEPMGHNIFAWRIEDTTDGGNITVRRNVFIGKPAGNETYLRISEKAKTQIIIENNERR